MNGLLILFAVRLRSRFQALTTLPSSNGSSILRIERTCREYGPVRETKCAVWSRRRSEKLRRLSTAMDDLLELAVSENLDLVGWMRADGWTVSCESLVFPARLCCHSHADSGTSTSLLLALSVNSPNSTSEGTKIRSRVLSRSKRRVPCFDTIASSNAA